MCFVVVLAFAKAVFSQQDPQYTQYIYNPSIINPAYAGSRSGLSLLALHRSQWVGLDGAPVNQTLSGHSPVGNAGLGLGMNLWHDQIGPATETTVAIDISYSLQLNNDARLNFGLKAGMHVLDVDFNKLNIFDPSDIQLQENVDNRTAPVIGIGAFYFTDNWYAGLSAPNLLQTDHFDENRNGSNATFYLVQEKIHFYAIAGYVFDLNEVLAFKPATLVKYIVDAPVQIDITGNVLFYDRLTLGVAYRWDAAVSGLAAFQINQNFMLGFSYDREVTQLGNITFNSGSYEVFLRYEIFTNSKVMQSPRFF